MTQRSMTTSRRLVAALVAVTSLGALAPDGVTADPRVGRIHDANPDLWKTGPVAMEVNGVMTEWTGRLDDDGYSRILPLAESIDDAIAWHTTLAHNKSAELPSNFVDFDNPMHPICVRWPG